MDNIDGRIKEHVDYVLITAHFHETYLQRAERMLAVA
jgi:hypothetical protein